MKIIMAGWALFFVSILQAQNVGIGTTTPDTKLTIANGLEASLSDGTGYLLIGPKENQNLIFDNNEIQSRNNEVISTLYLQQHGGLVDIGDKLSVESNQEISGSGALVPLKILGGSDANITGDSSGYVLIGVATSANIVMDNNEIMARNNNMASTLYLNNSGGKVQLGEDVEIVGSIVGNMNIEQTSTEIIEEFQLIDVTNCSWKNIYNQGSLVDPFDARNFNLTNGTNGQILIITKTGSANVVLNESSNVNLPSAWINIGSGDIMQLIYFSTKWHLISFTAN